MHRQHPRLRRHHERRDRGGVGDRRVQPGGEIGRLEDDGHAVMHRSHGFVRRGGQDRAAAHHDVLAGELPLPLGPQPGEGQRGTVGTADEVRLLCLATGDRCPFVEAVGGHDAALLRQRGLEAVLLGGSFAAGVDHPIADVEVLGPHRYEAPAIQLDVTRPLSVADHDLDVRARSDVVLGRYRLGGSARPEVLGQFLDRGRRDKTSTHVHDASAVAALPRRRRRPR